MSLTIEPVLSSAQLREFARIPRRLYQGMPGYVAPLDMERRELIDPKKSPFFSHGRAAYWIAYRGGRPVGRISAQIDDLAGPETPADLGQFGCLDVADDSEAVAALLRTAEDWLRERGRRHIRGPFILSINGESGLLIEGQTQPPMILLPWHPGYLERHVLAAGYHRAMKLFSFALDLTKLTEEDLRKQEASARRDFSIRSMNLSDFGNEMETARSIYNDGWRKNWGFVPGAAEDAKGLARSFKPLLMPDGGFFVCAGAEPVAFALTLPNVFDIAADLGAAPSILGWIKLAWRMRRQRYRSFRLVFIGSRSAYHGKGAGRVSLLETIRRARHCGGEKLVCAWVLESNAAFIRLLHNFNFSADSVFGIYDKKI